MIEVRFFATLRDGRGKSASFAAESVPTAGDLLHLCGIEASQVAILLINGFHSKPETPLKDGDLVSLFPPVGGG